MQMSATGGKALRTTGQEIVATACQLCDRPGHPADQCLPFRVTKPPNDKSRGRRVEEEPKNETNIKSS